MSPTRTYDVLPNATEQQAKRRVDPRNALWEDTLLSRDELDRLARARGNALVSLYLPTHRAGRDVRENPIRLKNLLAEAKNRATEQELDPALAASRLAPVERLVEDPIFWLHQGDGLALFVSEHGLEEIRLPASVEELVFLRDRFCVRPLVAALPKEPQRFHVLALSQNSVRLFDCTRSSIREIDLQDVPESLTEAVGSDWKQPSLQSHSGGPPTSGGRPAGRRRAAQFHGRGFGTEDSKDEITRFVRRVDEGLLKLLGDRTAPLVVAAVDYLIPIYHRVSRHPDLVAGGLAGNPEHLGMDELHARALELAAPRLDAARRELIERLHGGAPPERLAKGIEKVLPAVCAGRAAALLLQAEHPLWGRFDEASGSVEIHDRRQPGDDDLLDLAVSFACATGAEVYAGEAEEIPGGAPVAAWLRF